MRSSLRSLKYPDEEQVWKIVEVILCGSSNKINRLYLESDISNALKNEEFAGGRRNELFALAKAWSATLTTDSSDRKGLGIKLQYFSNETCVRKHGLEYVRNKCMLYMIFEVCD